MVVPTTVKLTAPFVKHVVVLLSDVVEVIEAVRVCDVVLDNVVELERVAVVRVCEAVVVADGGSVSSAACWVEVDVSALVGPRLTLAVNSFIDD